MRVMSLAFAALVSSSALAATFSFVDYRYASDSYSTQYIRFEAPRIFVNGFHYVDARFAEKLCRDLGGGMASEVETDKMDNIVLATATDGRWTPTHFSDQHAIVGITCGPMRGEPRIPYEAREYAVGPVTRTLIHPQIRVNGMWVWVAEEHASALCRLIGKGRYVSMTTQRMDNVWVGQKRGARWTRQFVSDHNLITEITCRTDER